ncbi:MAG: hypothetical protein PVH11_04845 [Anaerolineae bacterium]|jgi:hypothetical protein
MDRRFTALRIIGTVFKVLAWVVLLVGLLLGIMALIAGFALSGQLGLIGLDIGGPLAGLILFAVMLITAVFGFLLLYAIGEMAYLMLAIEENTRRSAYFVQQTYTDQQSTYPPPVPADYED